MTETIYTKDEILHGLEKVVKNLVDWTSQLSDEQFFTMANEKWAAGEQLEHLRKSSAPLVMALKMPKIVLRLKIGKANRATRDFAAVKTKYETKLATQNIGTTAFFPDADLNKSRQQIVDEYLTVSAKLGKAIASWQEKDLDKYILPHPLLGKMTVREMLFFTIHHTQHHHNHMLDLYS